MKSYFDGKEGDGAEEDPEGYMHRPKRLPKSMLVEHAPGEMLPLGEGSHEEEEERVGLIGDEEEEDDAGGEDGAFLTGGTKTRRKCDRFAAKLGASTEGRAEGVSGVVFCAYCARPEPPRITWRCTDYCGRSFHQSCKERLDKENNDESDCSKMVMLRLKKRNWKCSDCRSKVAECFVCKTKSPLRIFPKKGGKGFFSKSLDSRLFESREGGEDGAQDNRASETRPLDPIPETETREEVEAEEEEEKVAAEAKAKRAETAESPAAEVEEMGYVVKCSLGQC